MRLRSTGAVVLTMLVSPAFADTADLEPTKDNTIYDSATALSNAKGTSFIAGRTASLGGGTARRALVRFDVAGAVPEGATVNGASLDLFVTKWSRALGSPAQVSVLLHTLTADWGEGTSNAGVQPGTGAPATVGDATWLHRFFATTLWATSGGDFAATASATQSVGQAAATFTWSSAGLTADVQAWLDDPASNLGWIVVGDESQMATARQFASRENTTLVRRPRLTIDFTPPPPPDLVAAVLPSGRSVQVGQTATAFATIINTDAEMASACSIAPIDSGLGNFSYQTTDPATNELTGTPDTPVDIPGNNGAQSFVFAITPDVPFDPVDVELSFDCTNTEPAAIVPGLNTLLMSASSTPVPDIIALAATQTMNGVVDVPGSDGANAFAVATANVGAGGAITASADTGGASLPVALFICDTDTMGNCLTPPDVSVTTDIGANETPTFSIFVNGGGVIPFDPAHNRVFVRFTDGGGVVRGATSVAVQTVP